MLSETKLSKDAELFESYGRLISSTYPTFLNKLGLDKVAVKAQGATITDSGGKTYIDCIGGYGLFNVGHNNPHIIQSLTDQLAEQQLFTKPLISEVQVKMAECIEKITPGDLTCSFILNKIQNILHCTDLWNTLLQNNCLIQTLKPPCSGYNAKR